MPVLEAKNLVKRFNEVIAVNNVSFSVPENSIFGLIGRNGAGKTTTIRMLMNIYFPDEGEIFFQGSKIDENFKRRVGYLPEERGLYKKMKTLDTLLFFAEIKGVKGRDVKRKALEYLDRFDLLNRAYSKIEELSKGNQQKVQFIATILHDPDFIVLDEPFSGLDPINTELLKDIILEMKAKGKVIILSTHLMDYAEKLCDNVAMIHEGKIILEGKLAELKERFSKGRMIIEHEEPIDFVKELPFVLDFNTTGKHSEIKVENETEARDLLKILLDKDIHVNGFSMNDISLHEIFVTLADEESAEVKI